MHDVFLSYSKHDKPSADAVCHGLESRGIRCFIAPRDMMPRNWSGQLTQAIRSSKVFVLIFSENSNASDAVESEVSVAVQSRIHIVNFRIEAVDPSPDLELHLRKRHWLDAIKPIQKAHIDQLAVAIEKLIGPADGPPPPSPAFSQTGREVGAPMAPYPPGPTAQPQRTSARWVAIGAAVALLAGAIGWGLREFGNAAGKPKPPSAEEKETAVAAPPLDAPAADQSASTSSWKVQILTPTGARIEDGNPILARRLQGTTTWTDANGGVHTAENAVRFTLQMKSTGDALPGPFMVHYFLKEEGAAGKLWLDDTIAPGLLPVVTESYWKDQGYTRRAGWKVLDQIGAAPLPASNSQEQPFVFHPAIIFGKDGYLEHGSHEIGLEVKDAGENIVYRGILKLEVWETDPRDNLLVWIPAGDASGVPVKRIKSYPSTDAAGKTTNVEADLEFSHQLRNVSAKTIGQISMTTWFDARRPNESPEPGRIVATSTLAWARAPGVVPPLGFTAGNASLMPDARLAPGSISPTLSYYLGMGRGGWIPEGPHELAVEFWADGVLAYRGFHSILVPPGPAKPGLELLGLDGQSIPPNGVLTAEVSQKNKDVPNTGSRYAVALFSDLRYQASGIGPEHQSPHRADGYGDIVWLLFLPEALRPHPATRHSAVPFQLGDSTGPESQWAQGNVWGLLESGDPAPVQSIPLALPLDPSVAQPREGRPGLWVQEGDHRVRLLAVLRDQSLDRYPAPEAILFQRDFTLRVSQPQPIVLEGRP